MSLDHAILGFLSEQPMTGYDLKTHCFDKAASHFWTADQAQVYRTLERLETRGFVKARRERQRSRPDRRIYSVTPAGCTELRRWLASSEPPPPLRDPFLIRLRFAESLSDEELLGILEKRRATMQSRLESLRARSKKSLATDSSVGVLLERLTLDAAISNARASIDWLDDCVQALSDRLGQGKGASSGRTRRLPKPPVGKGEDLR